MNLIFRPLDMWTNPETRYRNPAPFFSSWSDTFKLLDREVDTLVNGNNRHTDVLLQVAPSTNASPAPTAPSAGPSGPSCRG